MFYILFWCPKLCGLEVYTVVLSWSFSNAERQLSAVEKYTKAGYYEPYLFQRSKLVCMWVCVCLYLCVCVKLFGKKQQVGGRIIFCGIVFFQSWVRTPTKIPPTHALIETHTHTHAITEKTQIHKHMYTKIRKTENEEGMDRAALQVCLRLALIP